MLQNLIQKGISGLLLSAIFFSTSLESASVSEDTDFGPNENGLVLLDRRLTRMNWGRGGFYQSDGRFILFGEGGVQDRSHGLMIGLAPDGSIDSSFGSNGILRTDIFSSLNDSHILYAFPLADGGIVVIGGQYEFSSGGPGPRNVFIAKFSKDGKVDENFGSRGLQLIGNSELQSEPSTALLTRSGSLLIAVKQKAPTEVFSISTSDGSVEQIYRFNHRLEIAGLVEAETNQIWLAVAQPVSNNARDQHTTSAALANFRLGGSETLIQPGTPFQNLRSTPLSFTVVRGDRMALLAETFESKGGSELHQSGIAQFDFRGNILRNLGASDDGWIRPPDSKTYWTTIAPWGQTGVLSALNSSRSHDSGIAPSLQFIVAGANRHRIFEHPFTGSRDVRKNPFLELAVSRDGARAMVIATDIGSGRYPRISCQSFLTVVHSSQ